MPEMVVSPSRRLIDGTDLRVAFAVRSNSYGDSDLWWRLPSERSEWIADDRLDAALVGLLYPAMMYGENIRLSGLVSRRLLFNIQNYTIPLLLDFSPALRRIEVTADGVSEENYSSHGVGTGFSAGVDSTCTLYDRFVLEDDPAYKINSLLFMNAGSNGDWRQHGSEEFAARKFHTRFAHLSHFSAQIGLDLVPVDSNLHYYHTWWHCYTHTLKAASTVLLLQRKFVRYFYASTLSYGGMIQFSPAYHNLDIGIWCDPILLPQLSTESLEMISDGCSYTRFEKLERIADYMPSHEFLNVCVDHIDAWENCSRCDKCMRTMLALDVLKCRDRFSRVFNWSVFDENKELYVAQQVLAVATDPFASDTINRARSTGYPLPNESAAKKRLHGNWTRRVAMTGKRMVEKTIDRLTRN